MNVSRKARRLALRPFSPLEPPIDIKLSGTLGSGPPRLRIIYELYGRLGELVIPAPSPRPARQHGLWQGTCFEVFLGVKNAPGYWEVNLSPAGDWNVYRFAAYRQGMAGETAFTSLPCSPEARPGSFSLALELDLAGILRAGQPLEVGLAAVLQLTGGGLTYWALAHPGPRPDFHRRESFTVAL